MSLQSPQSSGLSTTEKSLKKRKGSKHDRSGCLTCRQRHKKCTENTLPVCGACARLNLECVRPSRRHVVLPDAAMVPNLTRSPFADLFPGWQVGEEHFGERTLRRQAIRYYIDVLSSLLTVSTTHNAFISAFVPMAMESETLANALITYAASHMSGSDPGYSVVSLHARSQALSRLAKELTTTCVETNIAACMVLLTSEVCDGNYATWYTHLMGAKQLICSSTEQGEPCVEFLKRTSEGQWLLRNFAYHDILGSVTSGQPPIMGATYLRDLPELVDSYLGVATPVLIHIAAVSELGDKDHENIVSTWRRCLRLRRELFNWTCPSTASAVHTSLAHVYQGAALIYLYGRMQAIPHINLSNDMGPCDVDQELRHVILQTLIEIQRIPETDPAESALLFPLYIIGGHVTDHLEMQAIRQRLSAMYRKRRFNNILRTRQTLESIWTAQQRRTNAFSPQADWRDVANSQDGGLLLLT